MTITTLEKTTEKKATKLTKTKRILNFLSSLFTATAQEEFYNTQQEQRDAILDAHKPVLEEYREFYALLLLSNINDLNKQIIIYNLLKQGKGIPSTQKKTENEIIYQGLNQMPPQRAYKTFKMLRHLKVNNTRTRWLAQKFFSSRKNIILEAVKYKNAIKEMVVHNHLYVENSEVFDFLFEKKDKFKNKLFNDYVKAKTDVKKVYELPYSVAEGFAAHHKIDRKEFLKKIQGKMTVGEKLRMQNTAKKEGVKIEADWSKFNLVQLLKYLRTQTKVLTKHQDTVKALAKKEAESITVEFDKVAVVLDNSASSYGSDQKKYHPISVGQAITEVLKHKSKELNTFLVNKSDKFLPEVYGSTNLGRAVLEALKTEPNFLIIVSDGYENEVAGVTAQIIDTYKNRIDKDNKTTICHINPVFSAEVETVRKLSDTIPVVGIRDTKQLQTSFFLLKAREDLNKAIDEFKGYLITKKRPVDFNKLKNYLLTE